MSKAHRGKGIKDRYANGRGECPVCKRNKVKILYEQEAEGQKFNVCKTCKAAIKNGKKSLPVAIAEQPIVEETPAAVPVAAAVPAAVTEAEPAAEPVAQEAAQE